MRVIDYARLASRIQVVQSQNPRVTETKFLKGLKGIANRAELKRLFDLFAGSEMIFMPSTKRMFTWNCKIDHFTPDFLRDCFRKYSLQSTFGKQKGLLKECVKPISKEPILKKTDIASFSTEELISELLKRKHIKEVRVIYE